jgi:hypothetical protein
MTHPTAHGHNWQHNDCIAQTFALYTQDTQPERQTRDMGSRAGIYIKRYEGNIRSQKYNTDMRNVQQVPGSPKLNIQIKLDKTTTVLGARIEQFWSITDMICHWEGLEEKEKDEFTVEEGRKRRLSRVMRKLSGKFEREGGRDHISQPGGRDNVLFQVKEGSEGDEVTQLPPTNISFSNVSKLSEVWR